MVTVPALRTEFTANHSTHDPSGYATHDPSDNTAHDPSDHATDTTNHAAIVRSDLPARCASL
jgi:hypothetical protein